jgi:hypothetical protein
MKKVKTFIIAGIVALPSICGAQDDLNKTVQVTRAYDPIISDAEKIEATLSTVNDLLNVKTDYQYTIKPPKAISSVTLRPIPAAKINENPYSDPQWLYARLGAGFPLQLLADLYIQNIKPANLAYGAFYNHRSIWGAVNSDGGKIPIDEMRHKGGIFMRKNWEKLALNVTGGFDQHKTLFHGYDPDKGYPNSLNANRDSIAQLYTSFNLNANLASVDAKEQRFRYKIGALFDMFGDNGKSKFKLGRTFAMNENKVGASIYTGLALAEGKHVFAVTVDGALYLRNLYCNANLNDKDFSDTRFVANANPSYQLTLSALELELGAQYTVFRADSGTKHRIYPKVNVKFNLASEFAPFAGIGGGVSMNDYKTMAAENPFLKPGMNMAIRPTENPYTVFAGVRGNISNVFAYDIYGKYSLLKDLYFYNAAIEDLHESFDVIYDDVQEMKLAADLRVSAGPVNLAVSGAYYIYTLDELNAAPYRPPYTLDLDATVALTKSLKLGFDIHYRPQTPYSDAIPNTLYNDAFADLGVSAEYVFTRSFSVFINADNLLNNKYGFWYAYRMPGINAAAGITLKF